MNHALLGCTFAVLAAGVAAAPCDAQLRVGQRPATPIPAGQVMYPKDGDTIVIDRDVRVRIVRRTQANARAIFNAGQRWVVLLVDFKGPAGNQPDGRVDASYSFSDVAGDWPLGERWEGSAVLEEYSLAGAPSAAGWGVRVAGGSVQLLSTIESASDAFADSSALATLTFGGISTSAGMSDAFDNAEARSVGEATARAKMSVDQAHRTGRTESGESSTARFGGLAPVRVGGHIPPPQKIRDLRPVLPPTAVQAGITGVVIIELTIAPDGTVAGARVLRSIPLLDQAALDAVRQWRYTPTLLNGTAVPVIMTVTVNFTP